MTRRRAQTQPRALGVRFALAGAIALCGTSCGSDKSSARDAGANGKASAGRSSATGTGSSGMTTSGSGGTRANATGGAASTKTSTGGARASGGSGGSSQASGGKGGGTGGATSQGASAAAAIANQLGRDHFLFGLGNDLNNDHSKDGAYTLGVTLDIHYAYLSGQMGRNGWTDWNSNPTFDVILANSAHDQGVVPMFTLYGLADATHEGDPSVLVDDSWMKAYWNGAKLLFQDLGAFANPAIVHIEPDWWAFMESKAKNDASTIPAHVKANAPDCASQPDTLVGFGECWVTLARKYAPKTLIGFHASVWGDNDPANIAAFMKQIGAGDADIVVSDMLDRDAGCFEVQGDGCTRNDGPWYWDETNASKPNFHDYIAWSKAIVDGVGKPMLWWQVPLGVPSTTPGGTPMHYRDNRVHYIFAHVDEFVAAGGVGVVFGTGAGGQTDITSDGGQFKNAVTQYFAAPTPLP